MTELPTSNQSVDRFSSHRSADRAIDNPASDRAVVLDGPVNARDLGGLPTTDGGTVRRGALYRTDAFEQSTVEDVRRLTNLGVELVIDLRTPTEVRTRGAGALNSSSIEIRNYPVVDEHHQIHSEDMRSLGLGWVDIYEMMLTDGAEAFRNVFAAVAETDGAVVFHCQVGKDRTGMVAALLLGVAGCSDDVIADDYALTTHAMPVMRMRMAERVRNERGEDAARHVLSPAMDEALSSKREAMIDLLGRIRGTYGSIEGYLDHIGVPSDTVAKVRGQLRDDAGSEELAA